MKVIVDTNVLVSAILKNKEPETILLFIASHPDVEWIVSPRIQRRRFDSTVFLTALHVLRAAVCADTY